MRWAQRRLNATRRRKTDFSFQVVPEEFEQYYAGIEHRLLAVKPGITGQWQISGRDTIHYPERVGVELFYVDHFSLWLDVNILIKTIRAVCVRRRNSHTT